MSLAFGPVPSRRLGRSLGINNIPSKFCSYSCVYCQIGRTKNLTIERRSFYNPNLILKEVLNIIEKCIKPPNYITFVPDGEPTLDKNLGAEASLLKSELGLPLAILTNSSLLFKSDVERDLAFFDLVSLKVDAFSQKIWKKINRPHKLLDLDEIRKGIRRFSKEFSGVLITETMLIEGINTDAKEIEGIASFLSEIEPNKAYIAVPTRPPAEKWVKPASEENLVKAHEIFAQSLGRSRIELLTGYEGPGFHLAGDPIEALLSILSVHPMRINYAYESLSKAGLNPEETIQTLLRMEKIRLVEYRGERFLVKKL